MKPSVEAIREILKGVEGLQMLEQWQQSLTRDVSAKVKALLESVSEDSAGKSQPGEP